MTSEAALDPSSPVPAEELARLQRRSDAKGLARLVGHLAALAAAGALVAWLGARGAAFAPRALATFVLGFTLVTLFAAMHESVHRTAFASQRLNDAVAWFAGLLSFYNSTFYRPYHGWHHRFTQLPGRDPELEDRKPTSYASYLWELSGVPWWLGKLTTHARLALGRTERYGFLNERNRAQVVRSVRLQLAVYAAAAAASWLLGHAYFVEYWLVPVAVAQPALRFILLAEHTGCAENDDALNNTRTTYTLLPVRFLMWEMPYHAEHHRYPALPFFSLAEAHARLGPYLGYVAKSGYAGFHATLLKSFRRSPKAALSP